MISWFLGRGGPATQLPSSWTPAALPRPRVRSPFFKGQCSSHSRSFSSRNKSSPELTLPRGLAGTWGASPLVIKATLWPCVEPCLPLLCARLVTLPEGRAPSLCGLPGRAGAVSGAGKVPGTKQDPLEDRSGWPQHPRGPLVPPLSLVLTGLARGLTPPRRRWGQGQGRARRRGFPEEAEVRLRQVFQEANHRRQGQASSTAQDPAEGPGQGRLVREFPTRLAVAVPFLLAAFSSG